MKLSRSINILAISTLAAIYFFSAKYGLKLGPIAGVATPIWPPTGISLVALLIFGCRLWPGVFLGAFLINFVGTHSVFVSLGIAIGNTLEAVLAAYFLGRMGFQKSLGRQKDVIWLLGIAAIASTFVSALIGSTSILLGGIIPASTFSSAFTTWWIGDAISNLVITPFLLIWWYRKPAHELLESWRTTEETVLYLFLTFVSFGIFFGSRDTQFFNYLRPSFIYPLLIWATYRFGQRGGATSLVIFSVISIWGTTLGVGPFASSIVNENLLELQIYVSTLAVTFLFVGASTNERRQAVSELSASEKRFRRLVESDILGVFFWDIRGQISQPNKAFLKILGYAENENPALDWKKLTPREHQAQDAVRVKEVLGLGVARPFEKALYRKDGSEVQVLMGAASLEENREKGVAFVIDLTETKKILGELRRAVQFRDDLVAIVSHDLKNPVGSILLNAQLLLRRPVTNEDEKSIHRQAEMLKRTAYRMQKLIENMLDYSKIESGHFKINPQPEDAEILIDEILEILRPMADEKKQLLAKGVGNISHKVYCDHEHLLQVLSNLIGNSIKFSPLNGLIRVVVEEKNQVAHFQIEDSGPGIPKEQMAHIFDRYWQGKASGKQSIGLGLSIAKKIVETHGGKIWAENRQNGRGVIFHFTLPLVLGLGVRVVEDATIDQNQNASLGVWQS